MCACVCVCVRDRSRRHAYTHSFLTQKQTHTHTQEDTVEEGAESKEREEGMKQMSSQPIKSKKKKAAVFLGTFVTQLGIRSPGPFGKHVYIGTSFLVGLISKLSTVVKGKLHLAGL